jgi:hypothetical protein
MEPISQELVNRYIKSAKPFAKSKTELLAIQLAVKLNSPPPHYRRKYKKSGGKFIGTIHAAAEKQSKPEKTVRTWREFIVKEIHATLCKKSSRFKKEFAVLKHSGEVLVLYISSTVANKLQVNVVIVAAPVAALLRVIFKMGISVFCKKVQADTF